MLTLQRASAGSGKTFMLAKLFIWYFITVEDKNGRRLRSEAELSDSLDHILAITFTNKATNEMKVRIVSKLWGMARYSGKGKKPDYLEDFAKDLGVAESNVSKVAGIALQRLLNEFSDFHVSTIDSFFQGVLRTFAYEVDIRDSYQLEIDGNFLDKMSADSTLENLSFDSKNKSNASWWIEILMRRKRDNGSSWDIFRQSSNSSDKPGKSASFSSQTLYESFITAVGKIANEDFKLIRDELDEYFETNPDFVGLYQALDAKYKNRMAHLFGKAHKIADEILTKLIDGGVKLSSKSFPGYTLVKRVLEDWKYDAGVKEKDLPIKTLDEYRGGVPANLRKKQALCDDLERDYFSLVDAVKEWACDKELSHWNIYKENMPYLGLLHEVRARRLEFLEEHNTVELSETNSMLRSVINEDDAPFIYERLGSKLNHFLIDEFQDTSRLQWDNLNPLLQESMARGNDNLIIGDAKQSIYRFRNADPSIIMTTVPEEFDADSLKIGGMTKEENANWRSRSNIVRFNNFVFKHLASRLNSDKNRPERIDLDDLYANVVQDLRGEEGGYVEVTVDSGNITEYRGNVRERIVEAVNDLLSRGWRQKDIAVLVWTNTEASDVIEAFVAHNAKAGGAQPYINFVSDDSLKVANSVSVRMIVAALTTIATGGRIDSEGEAAHHHRGTNANFSFYAMRHPEMTVAEQVRNFLKDYDTDDAVKDLLSGMQTTALPALVEAVTAAFVPEALRKAEVAFIAAFQDLVLSYCERYPSDVASFLEYWKKRKDKLSVTIPEGMDAVNIMTLHKSKGLEFQCVIIPFASRDFSEDIFDKKPEWRWVRPALVGIDGREMPPYLPVNTTGLLKESSHEPELMHFYEHVKMDQLNTGYVGYTRAVSELYIWGVGGSAGKDGNSFEEDETPSWVSGSNTLAALTANVLYDLKHDGLSDIDTNLMVGPSEIGITVDRKEPEIDETDADIDSSGNYDEFQTSSDEKGEVIRVRLSVGNKIAVSKPEVEEDAAKQEDERQEGKSVDGADKVISEDDYYINPKIEYLKYKENDSIREIDDEEEADPRSEGSILHRVMERIDSEDDIEKALRRVYVQGLISRKRSEEFAAYLREQFKRPEISVWFDGSMRSLRERGLLQRGKEDKRPDRVLVKDDKAVVVDYKFGTYSPKHSKYKKQVREYMDKLKSTGKFGEVSGYLWYVMEGEVKEVE